MNLWQKLTIDWPCAVGDWLWLYVVLGTKAFLDGLTPAIVARAALQLFVLIVLLSFFQFIMAFDLTFLFYIDVATYPEIAAALFAVVAAGFAGRTSAAAAHAVKPVFIRCANAWSRFASRQRRNAIALRRRAGMNGEKSSDDEPAAWIGDVCAFAMG